MNRSVRWLLSFLLIPFAFPCGARAQESPTETIIPAGTLLRCTLDEPNFSTKTAEVGDPVLCPLANVAAFGHSALPRGAYLGGHLVAEKNPGHFVGKGYLQLEFDHIGLPDEQIPVAAKIIAVNHFRVDEDGKIIGHGHATRDAVEWALPPLWPLKVLTLPERGPRPTLKGEQQLTLRLMDDIGVPAEGWHRFEPPSSQNLPTRNGYMQNRFTAPQPPPQPRESAANNSPSPMIKPLGAKGTMLVLRDGRTCIAFSLRISGDQMTYILADGRSGIVRMGEINWDKTLRSNGGNASVFAAATGGTPQ